MKHLPTRMTSGRAITLGAMGALLITVLALDSPGRGNHRRVRNTNCENVLEWARSGVESGRRDAFAGLFARCIEAGWHGTPSATPEGVASCIAHLFRESVNPWDRTQRAYVDGHEIAVTNGAAAEAKSQTCQVTLVPTTLDGRPAIALFQRRPGLIRDTREWLVEPLVDDPAAPASPAPGRGGVR